MSPCRACAPAAPYTFTSLASGPPSPRVSVPSYCSELLVISYQQSCYGIQLLDTSLPPTRHSLGANVVVVICYTFCLASVRLSRTEPYAPSLAPRRFSVQPAPTPRHHSTITISQELHKILGPRRETVVTVKRFRCAFLFDCDLTATS